MNRGCLIALEGIDGAGTTSQVAPVASRLRLLGHDVLPTCEPTDGAIGRLLRQCLRAHGNPEEPGEATMALLFAADRLAHLAEIIEPALQRGAIVLTDRYVWSSFAYQSAALPADWVRQINAQARPADLTIYFDLPEEHRVMHLMGPPD